MTENPHLFPVEEPRRTEALQAMTDGLAHAESMVQLSRTALADALIEDTNGLSLKLEDKPHENIVSVLSRNGIIVCESEAALKMLDFQAGELIGKRFFDFIHTNEMAATYAAFLNVIEGTQKSASVRFRHKMGDGGFRWMNCTAIRINETTEPLAVFRTMPERFTRTMLRI